MQHPETAAGKPAAARQIRADHLRLILVARIANPRCRWAAISNGAATASCSRRQPGDGYLVHTPPLLSPMTSGHMATVLQRVRGHGLAEVRATWGTGMRALQVEFDSSILRPAA